VLPFESIGGSDDAYFADGITDEVRGKLTAIPGLRVTARASANQYRTVKKKPEEIGAELGVAYILTGTVRWATNASGGRTVRVTSELIDAATGASKWQESFDGELRDVFTTQTNIATQVAQKLDLQMNVGTQARLATRPTQNLEAYDEYLRGQQQTDGMANRDPKVLESALVHYQKAVALDSNFVNAWAAIAAIRASLFIDSPSAQTDSGAMQAVRHIQRAAPGSSAAHRAMAIYRRNVQKEFRGAYDELALAMRADPNNADLLASIAASEAQLGLFDSALVHAGQARRLDPKSLGTMRQYASLLGYMGRYEESVAEYDRMLAAAPTNLDAIQAKVRLRILQDDMPAAKRFIADVLTRVDSTTLAIRFAYYQEMMWVLDAPLLRKLVVLKPADFYKEEGMGSLKIGRTWLLLGDTARGRVWGDSALRYLAPRISAYPDDAQLNEIRGRANALAGRKAEAVADAERSLALRETSLDATSGPYYRFQVARILVQAGQYDRALDLLEPLLTTRATDVTPGSLKLDPTFAPLRGNPRYDKIVARK
jgi:TolB-like protein/tetratricopeptide (TPR) repeat protein